MIIIKFVVIEMYHRIHKPIKLIGGNNILIFNFDNVVNMAKYSLMKLFSTFFLLTIHFM